MPARIIGIAGSLRQGSYNAALLRAAASLAPPEVPIEIASIREIPLYDGDVETQAFPPAVAALKDRIAAADGLLLVSPEYNQSIPGVAKNAIDWLSRPPRDIARVFRDKPVGLIGATPGRGGTRMSQVAWLPVFRSLGLRPWYGRELYVADAGKVFDAGGALVDETVERLLGEYVKGYCDYVVSQRR